MPGWDRYSKELDEQKIPLIWALGHAWEEFVASLYPEWIWQPGETSRVFGSCRVYMNCDGLSPDPRGMTIEEAKYTSCAVRTGAEFLNDWLKIQQGTGYCLGYDAVFVRWHVLYNRQPWNPVYKRFLVRFDDKDLRQTERMISANAAGAVEKGYEE